MRSCKQQQQVNSLFYNKKSIMHQVLIIFMIGQMIKIGEAGYAAPECLADKNQTYCCMVQLAINEEKLNNINTSCVMRDYAKTYCNITTRDYTCNMTVAKDWTQYKNKGSGCVQVYSNLWRTIQECSYPAYYTFWGLVGVSLVFAILPCTYSYFRCSCLREVARLKSKLNLIGQTNITEKEYIKLKDYVIKLLDTSTSNSKFSFWLNGRKQKVQTKISLQKQSRTAFKTKVYIRGTDSLGTWTAQSYIVSRKEGVVFWMYKQYDDKKKAGQVNKKKHLIFQSSPIKLAQSLFGYWYYVGLENNQKYNGPWTLEPERPGGPAILDRF